jgi:hypothetical protein
MENTKSENRGLRPISPCKHGQAGHCDECYAALKIAFFERADPLIAKGIGRGAIMKIMCTNKNKNKRQRRKRRNK